MENGGLTGEGVVKVAINLPTEGPGTRAAADGSNANDEFEDAIESEYTVKNAIIALFKATVSDDSYDETTATFVTARSISLTDPETVDDNVQYRYEYTLDAVPMVEDNEQMLALAILNNNGLFSVDGGNLMYGQTAVTSYSSLAGLEITGETNADDFITNGFLMLNAPISDIASVASGSTFNPKVTTLAPVRVHEEDPSDMDNISADPIYVERAVAKVEVEVTGVGTTTATDNNDGTVSLPVTNVSGHSIKFTQWALNVTNKSSYILRNVTGYTTWATYYNEQAQSGALNRFFGSAPNPYRVYWAVDKNYSSSNATDFNQFYETSSTPAWHAMLNTTEATHTTNVDYCFENTMAAKQQIQGFTTGVLLEGQYQIDGNDSGDLFTLGSSSAVYDETSMLEYINAILQKSEEADKYDFDPGNLTEGLTIDTETEFTTYFKKPDGTTMTAADAKTLMDDQSVAQINYYMGGKTYYWTRPIKHFGDYYTPTYDESGQPVDYYDNAADYNENDHLGRYGVVRNNWYQINITSVSGPGYPEIPEIPTDPEYPDDGGEGFVKTDINILSWALRKQNVDL